MFILVDPSRGLVRVYCLYVCMFVFHSFLPYNSPGAGAGAGAGAVLFLKGRSRSCRKSGGSATLNFTNCNELLVKKNISYDHSQVAAGYIGQKLKEAVVLCILYLPCCQL